MSTAFTPTRMRISVDRYQQMVAAGVLTPSDRVELIEGEILDMAPIGTHHASVTDRLVNRVVLSLGNAVTVRVGGPIDLGKFSEPQPDLLVIKPRADNYRYAHPKAEDVLLLIEISDTSLAFDQGAKRELYARFGVSEYWVVDLNGQRVFAYLAPAGGAFQRSREYLIEETISPLAFPELKIALRELFA
jgi:Uma2 family endonuclease